MTSPDDLVVDLGVAAASSSFGIGFTGSDYLVDLELTALEVDGHAQVVARPKVITADKQTATIQSGTEIPYQEASSSGATSVSFKEAVLSLEVTPQITPDDRIIMTLKVNQDSVGQCVQRRSEYRYQPGQDAGAGRQRADGRTGWHLQGSDHAGDRKNAFPW